MDESAKRPSGELFLRRRDQACVAVFLLVALAALGGHWFFRGGHRGELVDIESAPRQSVSFRLNVNQAEWPEWSLLPGIGETLAKRIVASRRADGSYHRHQDLLRVKGIGPRTLANIRPFLQPIPDPAAP